MSRIDKISIKKSAFTVIDTNAPLTPKVDSLVECMEETDSKIAIVIKMGLKNGTQLERDCIDLSLGAGLGIVYKNREQLSTMESHTEGWLGCGRRESFGAFREVRQGGRGR